MFIAQQQVMMFVLIVQNLEKNEKINISKLSGDILGNLELKLLNNE